MPPEDWKVHSCKGLIDSALSKMDTKKPTNEIYSDAVYAVTKLGLLKKALEAGLFEKEAW